MKLTRQKAALSYLTTQLESGLKPERDDKGKTLETNIPLTDSDIKRIKSEIEILTSKIQSK